MAAVSYINPEVNPDTIHRYVVLGIRVNPAGRAVDEVAREGIAQGQQIAEGPQPEIVAVFRIQRSSYAKNIAKGMVIGAIIGGAAGVAVAIPCILAKNGKMAVKAASKLSLLGEKAALKVIGKSAIIGAGCGSAIGGITAVIKTRIHNRAIPEIGVDRALLAGQAREDAAQLAANVIDGRREEVIEMCRALFDASFDDVQALCPISHEVIVMPTLLPSRVLPAPTPERPAPRNRENHRCNAVYDFINIFQWVINRGTCPTCRGTVDINELRFCDRTFVRINRAVHAVLATLKELVDRVRPAELQQALDNPEAHVNAETAAHIRDGTISDLESAVIAAYMRPGIAAYNANITAIFLQQIQRLESLRNDGTLTPEGFFAESRRIGDWCETYKFPMG